MEVVERKHLRLTLRGLANFVSLLIWPKQGFRSGGTN